MDILYTGNVKLISQNFFDALSTENKNVIFSEKDKLKFSGKNIVVFDRGSEENQLRDVYTTFNFETVVYFSYALDGEVRVFDELEKLESNLYFCRRNKVKNFIYITTNDLKKDEIAKPLETSRDILMGACEQLCQASSAENSTNFIVIRAPYIYSTKKADNQLYSWAKEAVKKKHIEFRGTSGDTTDFLCDEDLGVLIARMIDEPNIEKYNELNISGDNVITFGEVEQIFAKQISGLEAEYHNSLNAIPGYMKNQVARVEYGWYPKHNLEEDIVLLIGEITNTRKEKKKRYERKERLKTFKDRLRIAVEMIIVFAAAEFLNYYTKDNVLVNFIDFRIIFVIIMGIMNGLNAGIIAAFLASAGYIAEHAATTQWQIIFYNVQNWLPFACYFLLGSMCGYNKDVHEDESRYAKEEHDILEKKYVFLNDLYVQALDSKEAFNNQILGYQNSFGKVYTIVKRLNLVLPDKIFFEAINVLEEILDNNSVAIYAINEYSDFARLNVCSKSLSRVLGKSLKLSDYPEVFATVSENKVYVNNEAYDDYPAYAAPIYRDGRLHGMIILKYAKNHQMNTEFANKFNIVTDLIRDSLFNALDYSERTNNYVDNTQFLEKKAFEEIIGVKEEMRENEYIDYVLLRLEKGSRSLEELSNIVSSMVRNSDVMGIGADNEPYLLLSQTKRDNMGVVEERMKKNNIAFEIVKG